MSEIANVYEKLLKLDVNEHTEKKKTGKDKELTYLSWAWAFGELLKIQPDMDYEIVKTPDGLPYVFDEKTGYMVYTNMTIAGKTKQMWLPVMDGQNRAMKDKPYDVKTKFGIQHVEAATMFDINKTIMRCLVKNAAMFGLGLYIYAGEDLPESDDDGETVPEQPKKQQPSAQAKVTKSDKVHPEKPKAINRRELIEELKTLLGTDDSGIKECIEALQKAGEVPQGKTSQMDDKTFMDMCGRITVKYAPRAN